MLEILSTYTNSTRMTLLLKMGGRQGGNYVWDYKNGLEECNAMSPSPMSLQKLLEGLCLEKTT